MTGSEKTTACSMQSQKQTWRYGHFSRIGLFLKFSTTQTHPRLPISLNITTSVLIKVTTNLPSNHRAHARDFSPYLSSTRMARRSTGQLNPTCGIQASPFGSALKPVLLRLRKCAAVVAIDMATELNISDIADALVQFIVFPFRCGFQILPDFLWRAESWVRRGPHDRPTSPACCKITLIDGEVGNELGSGGCHR